MQNGTTATRVIERRLRHYFGVHAGHLAAPRRCKLALASGVITLVCAAAVAPAATEAPGGSVVLWSHADQWVKIEPQDDPSAVPNDHPARLGGEAITAALAALQVRLVDPDTGTESHRPVFTPDELGNLAPHVAAGLAKAGPRQDVTFSTIDGRPLAAGGLIRKPGVNAGRIFLSDGQLNVIFGELQSGYRKKNVYGQRSEDFTPRRQGSRSEATEQKWILAAGPGLEFHSAPDGTVRNDWAVIDTAVARSEVLAAPQPSDAPARPATPAANADLEQRLRKLKELKDKGLISEEAYRARMHELLSEL
jgi:hypothetical protein